MHHPESSIIIRVSLSEENRKARADLARKQQELQRELKRLYKKRECADSAGRSVEALLGELRQVRQGLAALQGESAEDAAAHKRNGSRDMPEPGSSEEGRTYYFTRYPVGWLEGRVTF
ncbi:MAG: hypothetical protein Q8R13_00390 [bacterium]|nr:hypothetical protein [bacterium]MDZ4295855.1 hypothetical protein [Patescibacteria group bacterium]MDZ4295858.1 hypothetical protein [Patescibacteria group bacterium]